MTIPTTIGTARPNPLQGHRVLHIVFTSLLFLYTVGTGLVSTLSLRLVPSLKLGFLAPKHSHLHSRVLLLLFSSPLFKEEPTLAERRTRRHTGSEQYVEWADMAGDWEAGLNGAILGERGTRLHLDLRCQCGREKQCESELQSCHLQKSLSGIYIVQGFAIVLFPFWASKALCFKMRTLLWASFIFWTVYSFLIKFFPCCCLVW